MCFPRMRFSTSSVRRQVKLFMKAADSRCWSLCACLPASGSVPGSELLLTLARKNGKEKGGRGKINYLPVLSSNLCPPATPCASALHPDGPITFTRPPASTVMLLGGFSSTLQLAAEWSPTCNSCVIVARTGTSLQQRAVVERTHATVRLRGEASSVWKQQDRREVKNAAQI